MSGLVKTHCLINAVFRETMRTRDFPARFVLDQGQTIWSITIYFISTEEQEWSMWAVCSRQLKQYERARRIHSEISHGITCSPIVRRLRGGVDHDGDVPIVAGKDF